MEANEVAGVITSKIMEPTTKRASALTGVALETLDSQKVETTIIPFDRWALLPTLFPTWVGATTAAGSGSWSPGGTGALAIGTNAFDPSGAGTSYILDVWTPDGRLYQTVRAAVIKPPSMKLGNGQALYEQVQIDSIGNASLLPGASGFLFTGNAITESGAVNPDANGIPTNDFVNGPWSLSWGSVPGFTALQAEDFWQLIPEITYQYFSVQKLLRLAKLTTARFMVKGRPVGMTHTQLLGKIGAHTLGGLLTEAAPADVVLTGPAGLTGGSSKVITLKNAELVGAGFTMGGQKLSTDEVGFVTTQVVTTGVIQPQIIFSA